MVHVRFPSAMQEASHRDRSFIAGDKPLIEHLDPPIARQSLLEHAEAVPAGSVEMQLGGMAGSVPSREELFAMYGRNDRIVRGGQDEKRRGIVRNLFGRSCTIYKSSKVRALIGVILCCRARSNAAAGGEAEYADTMRIQVPFGRPCSQQPDSGPAVGRRYWRLRLDDRSE